MPQFSYITCKEKQENSTVVTLQESCWRTVQWYRTRNYKYWSTSAGRLRTDHFSRRIPGTQKWRDTHWTCKVCANRDKFPEQEKLTGCLWKFTTRSVMLVFLRIVFWRLPFQDKLLGVILLNQVTTKFKWSFCPVYNYRCLY